MNMLDAAGRRMAFWGALLLIAWAGYELSIRWDTIQRASYTVMSMAREGGVSLWDVMFKHRFIEVLETPLVLLGCVLLGVFSLLMRSRRYAAFWIVPLCGLFAWLNVGARVFFLGSLWQTLKAVPLVLIALGQSINTGMTLYIRNKKRRHLPPAQPQRHFLNNNHHETEQ